MATLSVTQDDITTLSVDVIVNAANSSLLGGGGVDGAIHRAAGPALLAECRTLEGCATGEAKLTKGYNLPARYVIHTVGPIWADHREVTAERLLFNCYFNSLNLCLKNHLEVIAFSNISTGVYGFPKQRAAEIALKAVEVFEEEQGGIKEIIFCCFDIENKNIYEALLANRT
ncbi:O-acetyl-ADP-ribose deacetylase [Terasakiella pusilla]|uniref:O-acetyl-ADP-ribose deacetylase n=1 Tax=Terasakiella pusilla TaxID=64973 RepID=UPI003AA86E85